MNKNTLILIGFIALKFMLQYMLISPAYDLQRDEYLHLEQANHLAWGFQSVPPFTSWISYLILLLGNSVFWIKFFPALFGATHFKKSQYLFREFEWRIWTLETSE